MSIVFKLLRIDFLAAKRWNCNRSWTLLYQCCKTFFAVLDRILATSRFWIAVKARWYELRLTRGCSRSVQCGKIENFLSAEMQQHASNAARVNLPKDPFTQCAFDACGCRCRRSVHCRTNGKSSNVQPVCCTRTHQMHVVWMSLK